MTEKQKPMASTVVLGTNKAADGTKELVRFSHLHVHSWRLNNQSKKEEASVQLMVPKENKADHAALVKAFEEQLAFYKAEDGEPGSEFHYPIVDGDTRKDSKGRPKPIPGHWIVSAKVNRLDAKGQENQLPECVGINRDDNGKLLPLAPSQIKSGDWGRASINFKFFVQGKGGVGCYLNSVQRVKAGEALSSRKSATDEFGAYDDEDDDILG